MKIFRFLKRGLRDSFKSVFRNFSLSIAAIACSTITLILVAVAIVISYNVESITEKLESELTIVVYLKKDVTDEQIENLKSSFVQMKNVEEVEFKDNEEWKLEMKEYSETYSTTLDYLEENPLLDSFVVKVKDVSHLKETTEEIREFEYVESANYGEGMAETLISAFNAIEKVTLFIVIALVFVTAFLISNTIKLTIFSRRNEIEIMRLVGTSNTTIKLPFIFEGFILGFLGSIIPILTTIYGYVLIYDHFSGYILSPLITLVKPFNFVLYVSVILLIIGCLIGMFGSYRAVRKYLKI
jgi:cell division transport system permease protein